MIYKQKTSNSPFWSSPPSAPVDDQHKLLELWREEEVEEDYQAIVLHYFDALQNRGELARQIQAELRRTYQRDSHYFRIDKLLKEREKALDKLERQVELLERYKRERGEPNLQPICELIDHVRKVHLLIAEEVQEMFAAYGHPKNTGVGYSYLTMFKDFDEDVQFLKESLLRFYVPFSGGFDPLFLQLSQKLRKCYANDSLVYDQNVEQLINLNASYLYRLLRAHQRMLEFISAAEKREQQPIRYHQKAHSYQMNTRNILQSIAEEEHPKHRSTELTQRYEIGSRMIPQYQNPSSLTPKYIHSLPKSNYSPPKNTETSEYPRALSPINRKETAEIGIQKEAPRLNIVNNNISIPKHYTQVREKVVQEKQPRVIEQSDDLRNKLVRTPKRTNAHTLPEMEEPKHLHFYRRLQPQQQQQERSTITHHGPTHKRAHTQDSTIAKHRPHQSQIKQSLPKLNDSRGRQIDTAKPDCLCRKRYREKHCEHDEEDLSEAELERRRRMIIRQVQAKYKAMAQREMRHQLSKLGDMTYHKLRNQSHSRQVRQKPS